jgi:hypothetical protein
MDARFRGRIKRTNITPGRTVFQNGKIVGKAGWGTVLEATLAILWYSRA